MLVGRADEVVSREELEQALWGGAFVDAEHGINTAIHKVREALEDDAQNPRFVATVARRGYRFIAPVAVPPEVVSAPLAVVEAPAASRRSQPSRWLLLRILPLAAAVALFAVAVRWVADSWSTPKIRAIAVLPLEDLTPGRSESHLASGLTELLITELARSTDLRVISRTSVTSVRREQRRVTDIARELGVQAVIEGAVTRSGQTLRITVQLIDAATDGHLWADSFDGDLADLLDLEQRVARAVAHQVRATVKLEPSGPARPTAAAAQELYMRGRELFYHAINRPPPERYEILAVAIEKFTEAIAIEPRWALPLAARAHTEHWMSEVDPERLFTQARADALRAIELDDSAAEAHGALGYVSAAYFRDYALAEREFRRAVELDPNTSYRHGFGMLLTRLGRFDEATESFRRAQELDPLAVVLRWNAAANQFYARHFDEALSRFRELEAESGDAARAPGAQVLTFSGRAREAVPILRETLSASTGADARAALICALSLAGQKELARTELTTLLHEKGKSRALSAARAFACMGEAGEAMTQLERAFLENQVWLLGINVDPAFDGLRGDPRFLGLLERMGVPDVAAARAPR